MSAIVSFIQRDYFFFISFLINHIQQPILFAIYLKLNQSYLIFSKNAKYKNDLMKHRSYTMPFDRMNQQWI
jgi:hypothetical protein